MVAAAEALVKKHTKTKNLSSSPSTYTTLHKNPPRLSAGDLGMIIIYVHFRFSCRRREVCSLLPRLGRRQFSRKVLFFHSLPRYAGPGVFAFRYILILILEA